jgi:thiol:disulfide interchange protein
MNSKLFIRLISAAIFLSSFCAASEQVKDDLANVQLTLQHSAMRPDSNNVIRVTFETAEGWHFYALNAFGKSFPDTGLKVNAYAEGITFGEPIFPYAQEYFDKVTNQKLGVYSGTFNVFIPFTTNIESKTTDVNVTIDGVACNDQLCKKADYKLSKTIEISNDAQIDSPAFGLPAQTIQNNVVPTSQGSSTTAKLVVLPLAVLAGLLLNVMPCVWPILPIIVMRLVTQAQNGKAKSLALGVAFAIGVILFFAALAVVNIILKLGFGMVFQWGDQFRNPAFVMGMALLMVVLALYMFGLFTLGLPAVSTGKGKGGFLGSIGMGFLAAVLSTPCSFAILTFVLAWAQTQPIPLATVTILLIGVGMGAPYVVLTMIPKMLAKIPKPGRWMELFKHATGFILLAIAVKLLEAVPADRIINILYYAVVLAICVWMWGVCITYETPQAKKWSIRFTAVLLAIIFAFLLLTAPSKGLISWKPYDAQVIAEAQAKRQPVLIEFTADWCFSCKVLERTVYSNEKIAELIKTKGVLAIKGDTTNYDSAATKALKEIYNQPAVPVTILLLPGEPEPIPLTGNLIKNKLISYLQDLRDKNKDAEK